jgi:hypothetical protein
MKLLELVMIVKNSGEIIRDCLRENKKWIDHWTILDTGSTDNTPEIIQNELKDIPGNLYFGEFVDFSQARNKSLELSSKTCKYTIILDDSYKLYGGLKLRDILSKENTACFLIKIGKFVDSYLRDDYYSKRIIRSSDNLQYKYRVHEDIVVSESKIKSILDANIFIDDLTFKDHTTRSFNRYKRDIEMLLLDHEDDPTEQRTIYYIAKTYYLLEKTEKSLEFYRKLRDLKKVREDFLFASYYETACIEYDRDADIDKFETSLLLVEELFKNRVEASYKLAVIHKDVGNLEKVNEIVTRLISYPKPVFLGTLLENDIYDYYIPYLYIDTNINLGNLDKAIPVLKKMLTVYPNDQPMLNMRYSVCDNLNISSIALSDDKTIVIHTSSFSAMIYCWNPSGDKRISGSEYMAMNLAKEFHKLGYRVFIIGTFEDKKNNINYEGIYDGIEYIDYKYFSEFALKYQIDYLIVSRYTENLVYYDNIKRVYLWMHDTLPVINDNSKCIQYHKTKFKRIIGITDWQKKNTVRILNVPEDNIVVSRNAIYMERFINKDVEKTRHRFIYSSAPERGLDYLIQLIPKIKEKYDDTTLYLFVNKDYIDSNTLNIIDSLDYVYLKERIPQDQLAVEFLKSDVWFYPTNFSESYCITALEAMASKCLIATVDYCGLGNIVKGKGILCEPPIQDNVDELIDKLFFVLERPALKNHFINTAYNWVANQTYEKLAQEWIDEIFTL